MADVIGQEVLNQIQQQPPIRPPPFMPPASMRPSIPGMRPPIGNRGMSPQQGIQQVVQVVHL